MNMRFIIGLAIATVLIFGAWLFFWVLVECWYAMSLDPMFETPLKTFSFVAGFLMFVIGFYSGAKMIA